MNEYLEISAEVQKALREHGPIVALESTIISHGMPYPENVEMAKKVEDTIRQEGAIPATIAILNGKLKVGLSLDEIEYIARQGRKVDKVSRRDLPFIIAKKHDGATTVAGTMIIAAMAGIKIFATGGIGGVHRGANETFDISADLQELATSDVAVVCAGAKSILDLNLTLEYLETFGVPVVGYKTTEFPAFYTRKSGLMLEYSLNTPKEIAQMLYSKWNMGLKGGVVIANPILEEDSMDPAIIKAAIEEALASAQTQGIKGKETTPYLLSKIKELTLGDSLDSNLKLVYNNAHLAAKIAFEFVNR